MRTVSRHSINGRFVDSHGQDTVDIHNPATGELIGRSTRGDAVDAERAIAAAKAAFPLAGRVMINQMVDDPASPFGGFKMSGFGREFGVHGLRAYLETRTVYAS